MAENENLASILVKSGLNSIFTDSPIGYFSKFANVFSIIAAIFFSDIVVFTRLVWKLSILVIYNTCLTFGF